MIVDAHRHYWDPLRLEYAWLQTAPVLLQRTFLPGDLEVAGDACVLIQAAPSEDETRFLFDLARQTSHALGVVGWTDLEAQGSATRIDHLIADGGGLLCGLRPMVQDLVDPDWLLSPALDPAFDHLRNRGLVFDALVDGRHLTALQGRLARHPGLRTVIDHAAKPDINADGFSAWAGAMSRLAQMPYVFCKLSGLATQSVHGADAVVLEPYAAHLFSTFGPTRVLWGSDWPVVTTAASYIEWKACAHALVQRHAPGAQAAIFGGNAIDVYSLDVRTIA